MCTLFVSKNIFANFLRIIPLYEFPIWPQERSTISDTERTKLFNFHSGRPEQSFFSTQQIVSSSFCVDASYSSFNRNGMLSYLIKLLKMILKFTHFVCAWQNLRVNFFCVCSSWVCVCVRIPVHFRVRENWQSFPYTKFVYAIWPRRRSSPNIHSLNAAYFPFLRRNYFGKFISKNGKQEAHFLHQHFVGAISYVLYFKLTSPQKLQLGCLIATTRCLARVYFCINLNLPRI